MILRNWKHTPRMLITMLLLIAPALAVADEETIESHDPHGIKVSTIHASDFVPTATNSSTDYQIGGTGGAAGEQLWCNEGDTTYLGVFRDIPDGAILRFSRYWYWDNHGVQDMTAWLQKTCLPFDSGAEPETTILRTSSSSGTPGYGRVGPGNFLDEEVDNQACVYAVRVRLGNGGSCAAGGNLRFLKAVVSWQLPDGKVFADRFEQ